jgi:hypothetical protein
MRQRLIIAARAILLGWVVLFLSAYLLERPLLPLLATLVGASWLPTIRLAFDCAALAATGWVIGRFSRPAALWGALIFAATLAFWDFGELLEIRIPWLLRLAADALHDSRYWGGLMDSVVLHALLFGSLLAGAQFSRGQSPAPGPSLGL